jgi:hypothetical protein
MGIAGPINAYMIVDALSANAPAPASSTAPQIVFMFHSSASNSLLTSFLANGPHPGVGWIAPDQVSSAGAAIKAAGYKAVQMTSGGIQDLAQNNTLTSCANGTDPGAAGTLAQAQKAIDNMVAAGAAMILVDEPWGAPCDPANTATSAMSIAYDVKGYNIIYDYIHTKYPGVMFGLSIGDDGGAPLHLAMLQAGLKEDIASLEDFNSCCETATNPLAAQKAQFPNVKTMVLAYNTITFCGNNAANWIAQGGVDYVGFWDLDNYGGWTGPWLDANWLQNAETFASSGGKVPFCALAVSRIVNVTWATRTSNFTGVIWDYYYNGTNFAGTCDWMVMSGSGGINGPNDPSMVVTQPWTTRTCSFGTAPITITVGLNGNCRTIGSKTCLVFTRNRTASGQIGNVTYQEYSVSY